ncbi:2-amino-4-hydroxy-6-hydroxymethyldihydropteridine diphosphokinase [Rubrivirga sp.]|uniref:2-amino-4-hydroxy-6- hydroxymethyldihydropteridine diphosphokinase n=1 Tax=Rubrivirga sp. TaxID=1885344 RepID=UPI003B51893F
MTEAFVALGANLGDRLAALRGAVAALDALPETAVVASSAVYETAALVRPGAAPQPDHLNAVVGLQTRLDPPALLRALRAIERAAGREPAAERWAPRPLDLDLLLWGDDEIAGPDLTVPHPALDARRFVLVPLADVAADRVVPGLGRSVADLLDDCPDTSRVERTSARLWP